MRGQRRFGPILVSRSGRRYLPPYRRIVVGAAGVTLFLGIVAAALTLYTPYLHFLAGDWTGVNPRELGRSARKVVADNLAAATNVIRSREPRQRSPLPDVQLILDPGDMDSLNDEIIPYGYGVFETKPRVRGWTRTADGNFHAVQVAYRGTNTWHHQAWKPSLRIRYPQTDIVDGFRNHVIIAPESPTAMRNWLSIEMGRRWNLLNSGEHFVRLFMNNHYKGLYTRVWRLDESLLINARRLPGPFFRLEDYSGPVFQRIEADFWQPDTWEVKGIEPDDGSQALNVLYQALKESSAADSFTGLNDLVDREAYAKWLAVRCHAGEVHIGGHNLAFWLDTTSGKLVPLLLDVNGYGWAHPGMNLERPIVDLVVPISKVWQRDPRNLALYVDRLYELLTTIGSAEECESLVEQTWKKIRSDAVSDLHTSEMGTADMSYTRTYFPVTQLDADVEKIKTFLGTRIPSLLNQLQSDRVWVVHQQDESFELLIEGLAGVAASRKDGQPFKLIGDFGGASISHMLYPTVSTRTERRPPVYAFYRIPGQPDDYQLTHRLNNKPIDVDSINRDVVDLRDEQGTHWQALQTVPPEPAVLGPGRVQIDETVEFAVGQTVKIAAGTQLMLAPDVSIYIRGPLLAEGTAQQPVTIRPLISDRPFGVIGVFGEETAGTVIRYLDCEGGGTAQRANLFFTGMFSIHDCENVVIEDCRFARNLAGDDTIHLARCRAEMRRCRIENALSDAVDWDKVDGKIESCEVKVSGNDGLDLSMGDVQITDCRFYRCGDKGISVGEGSNAIVTQCQMDECVMGVAAKDSSQVWMENCQLRRCQTGWSGYCKKWRWAEGGTGYLSNVTFEDSQTIDISGDALSRVVLSSGMKLTEISIAGKVFVSEQQDEFANTTPSL